MDSLKKVLVSTLPVPTAAEGSSGADVWSEPAFTNFFQETQLHVGAAARDKRLSGA